MLRKHKTIKVVCRFSYDSCVSSQSVSEQYYICTQELMTIASHKFTALSLSKLVL